MTWPNGADVTDEPDLSENQNYLQRMLEDAGSKVTVLTTLHEDLQAIKDQQIRFARRMLTVCAMLALVAIAALAIGIFLIGDVRDAQRNAASATAGLTIVTGQNRAFIDGLDEVARKAQENGAATSKQQCGELEKLKAAIRAVIRSSPQGRSIAADVAVNRFKRRDCDKLPNAKPVAP